MRRNKNMGLVLAAALLCLGACGPKAEGEQGRESVKETVSETAQQAEENGDSDEAETAASPEEPTAQAEGQEEEEPVFLSLMTNSQYDHVWEDDRRLCYVDYRRIWLDDGEDGNPETGARGFPELARALKERNDQTESAARKALEEQGAQARELAAEGVFHELSSQSDAWVVRADSQVLSLLTWDYSYMGGAHGDYGYTGVTFDSRSGRELELGEVVTDPGRLAELASDRLGEKYPDVDFFEAPQEVLKEKAEDGSLTWTAGYQGITLYFSPYMLAPYAYGTQSVTILYEEAPELFVPEIRRVPDSWAVSLAPGLDFDLGCDGILDAVEAGGVYGEYGDESAYEEFRVSVNGQESRKELWFYRENSYLVHSGDLDTELLITETRSDNDFPVTLVYELDPEKEGFQTPWEFSSQSFCTFEEQTEDGEFWYGTEILTDPDHFQMQTRFHLLSTYSGSRWYKISETAGSAGYLNPEQSWYDVDRGDQYLTLLIPLEMKSGEAREPRVFPAGTKLWIVRVEGNDVGFLTEDGISCQVTVDPSGWPAQVEGMDDSEIFDGMMFAG